MTYVFVRDFTRGYGIFIENMMEHCPLEQQTDRGVERTYKLPIKQHMTGQSTVLIGIP